MSDKKNTDIDNISGDYQYEALNKASSAQRQWHKNRLNLINYLHFFNKHDVILDAGCGSGNVILKFAPFVKSAIGIDNNKKCVSFLKQKIRENNLSNANAIEMDLLQIKLNKTFTKITLCEVLEHFNQGDGVLVLEQIKKMLSPNGKVLITTPNYLSPWVLIEGVIDLLGLSPKLWGKQHLIKFTPKKLRALVERTGLSIEKQGTLNAFSPFIAPISENIANKISYLEFSLPSFGNLLYVVVSKKTS